MRVGQGAGIREFHNRGLGTGCTIGHWVVRKMVLGIACFGYSIIIIIIIPSFVVLLN